MLLTLSDLFNSFSITATMSSLLVIHLRKQVCKMTWTNVPITIISLAGSKPLNSSAKIFLLLHQIDPEITLLCYHSQKKVFSHLIKLTKKLQNRFSLDFV